MNPAPEAGGGSGKPERSSPPPGPRSRSPGFSLRSFAASLFDKAAEDNIFFMAGAITFNLLVAIVPFILLVVGISAMILSARGGDAATAASESVLQLLFRNIPEAGDELRLIANVRATIENILRDVLGESVNLSLLGAVIFVWISTRLVGTLRVVLGEIFGVGEERGIVRGKLFDARIVVVAGILFLVNFAGTLVLDFVRDFGVDLLGLEGWSLQLTLQLYALVVAFASIWAMFFLIYRYLPARKIPVRTAAVAATFTSLLFELVKSGFSWYVTTVANFTTAYGGLAVVAVLFIWIYYSAIIFILGGEVAQLEAIARARRDQRSRLMAASG